MGDGKPYPPFPFEKEPYRVEYDSPDDPTFPHNWPFKKKVVICIILGYTTFAWAWGSSIFASAVPSVSNECHVGKVVATLGISLYVLRFASGPIIWAPLSETYG